MIGQQEKQHQAAIYCRLSRDDGSLTESSSICTQREMLTQYVREQGWKFVGEYIDDGYSGTSFDRPDFKRMISDIQAGKINCIITKDLSRLGRNYLEVGAYIEIFFPEHGVRYIALNDGVDTSETSSSMDITPFKNLINEMYACDISKKIRTAKKARFLQGKYMGTYAPYGYKKDPTDKNHLIIDEELAPIVRRIYDLAKQGLGISRIRQVMSNEKVLRPGVSVWKNDGSYNRFFSGNDEIIYNWGNNSVRDILRDPVYVGHLAGGKRYRPSIKSKKHLYVPTEEWTIVKNTHEAIISQEDWDLVQRLITSRRRPEACTSGYDNIFAGLIKCADCGYALRTVPVAYFNYPDPIDNTVYCCNRYAMYSKAACSQHRIRARDLHNSVLLDIQKHAKMAVNDDKNLLKRVVKKFGQNEKSEIAAIKNELRQTEKRLSELDRLFAQLYEDRLTAKISDRNYRTLSDHYEDEQKQLDKRVNIITKRLTEQQTVNNHAEQWIKTIKEYAEITDLSAPILNALLDQVTVSEAEKINGIRRQTISVYYKFIGCISE